MTYRNNDTGSTGHGPSTKGTRGAPGAEERSELLGLLAMHAYEYREEPFVLKSGRKSHHYVDCRRVLLHPRGRELAGLMVSLYHAELWAGARGIAGVALGGLPFAGAVADRLARPLVYVRPEPKIHGHGQQVEAAFSLNKGAEVLLVEDVVTTGGSTIAAIMALDAAGFPTRAVIALVDREEGGSEVITGRTRFERIFTRGEIGTAARRISEGVWKP